MREAISDKQLVLGFYKLVSMNKAKKCAKWNLFLLRMHLIFYHLIQYIENEVILKTC